MSILTTNSSSGGTLFGTARLIWVLDGVGVEVDVEVVVGVKVEAGDDFEGEVEVGVDMPVEAGVDVPVGFGETLGEVLAVGEPEDLVVVAAGLVVVGAGLVVVGVGLGAVTVTDPLDMAVIITAPAPS
jgi:hypothetical protein